MSSGAVLSIFGCGVGKSRVDSTDLLPREIKHYVALPLLSPAKQKHETNFLDAHPLRGRAPEHDSASSMSSGPGYEEDSCDS